MKFFYKLLFLTQESMIVLATFEIVANESNSIWIKLLVISIGITLLITDLFRRYKMYSTTNGYIFSLFLSLAGCVLMLSLSWLYMGVYFFAIASEAFYMQKRWTKIFIIIHGLCFALLMLGDTLYGHMGEGLTHAMELITDDIGKLFIGCFLYTLSIMSFYSFNQIQRKKYEAEQLNEKLAKSNEQLKEYSEKIEKLTISKERDRVAQELHDSLGHTLTALIMHLDFLEKVIENDKNKAKELTQKTQEIARDSMKILRKAVYAIQEEHNSLELTNSIQAIVKNITNIDGITVDYKSIGNIEEIPAEYKNIIFKIVQESITNGLKHGKATHFEIRIIVNNSIKVFVKNNGFKCLTPIKGNGLMGIEKKVWALNGVAKYLNIDEGFGIDVFIPLEGG